MTRKNISNAVSNISNRHIEEAADFQIENTPKKFRWGKLVAACLVLAVAVMGIFPLFNQPGTSPFVLTAYAMGPENEVVGNVMELGKSVPISTINTSTGKKCFVFSCDKSKYAADSSITILMQSNLFDDTTVSTEEYNSYNLSELEELATDPTQHYFIAVLGDQNAVVADMYGFPLYIDDNAEHTEQQECSILIMKGETGYTAFMLSND